MTDGSDDRLTPAAFERLLDVYGGDPDRWPAAERQAAAALVATSADAAARLDEARRLDAMMQALPAAEPSTALADRILADAPRPIAARSRVRTPAAGWRSLLDGLLPGWPAWQPAAALGLSLVAGLSLGLLEPATVAGLTGFAADGSAMTDVSDLLFVDLTVAEELP